MYLFLPHLDSNEEQADNFSCDDRWPHGPSEEMLKNLLALNLKCSGKVVQGYS